MGYSAGHLKADVNEVLMFANYTDEELYIELSIDDSIDWYIYDLYVLGGGISAADFWAVDPYATYSVCAYGEVTGGFYGCIEGSISDYYNMINFDLSGIPYKSEPWEEPLEWFVFDHPDHPTHTLQASSGEGCFVGALY
jgi:hypothetical protein